MTPEEIKAKEMRFLNRIKKLESDINKSLWKGSAGNNLWRLHNGIQYKTTKLLEASE